MMSKVKNLTFFKNSLWIDFIQVEMPDDHLMPVGFPNMFTLFKVVDRVTGGPVSGPDMQVGLAPGWVSKHVYSVQGCR